MIPSTVVPVSNREVFNSFKSLFENESHSTHLEDIFSPYIGSKYSILMNSGTSALYSLLKAYDLSKGDEILLPAYTCEVIGKLLLDMGFQVKFVDVDLDTYNLSIDDLEDKISYNTKAVIAIHMFGFPCQIDTISQITSDFNSILLEDCAQAMGAEFKGKKVGCFGDSSFFSMGLGKPITAVSGGLAVTNDERIADKLCLIADDYLSQTTKNEIISLCKLVGYSLLKHPLLYDLIYNYFDSHREKRRSVLQQERNWKYLEVKITDLQSQLGLSQFHKLESYNLIRERNANYLIESLSSIGVETPKIISGANPSFLRLPVRIEGISLSKRNELINCLKKKGIDAPAAYPNVLPYFYGMNSYRYKNAEKIVESTIVLPTHPLCTTSVNNKIVSAFEEFI